MQEIDGLISVKYARTNRDQQICFVLNKVYLYKVHVYIENLEKSDPDRSIRIAESKHITRQGADNYIVDIERNYLVNSTKFYENECSFKRLTDVIPLAHRCKFDPEKCLNPGDHICINRGFYHHDAIYIGNRKVIHMTKEQAAHEADWWEFLDDASGQLSIIRYNIRTFSQSEIVDRARIHQKQFNNYNLFTANCQFFATFCSCGVKKSREVMSLGGKFMYYVPSIIGVSGGSSYSGAG